MLNRIIKFSLDNRLLVLLGVVLVTIGGIYSARNIEVDVFPDLTMPTVVVLTDAADMAPEEIERLVTFPIETAVNGATNVRRVRSTSSQGFSFVWVEFDWGMDIYKARQVISEKLVSITGELPEGIVPMLAPQSSVMGEILFIGMQSDTTSMMELRTLAEWVVKPVILATGGVSQVTIIGGDYKQYQVLADVHKMDMYGVSMDELESAVRAMSVNVGGGVVRDYGNEYNLRGMGRTNNIEELGRTLVKMNGDAPVRVADVARVVTAGAVRQGYASLSGKPSVILSISKQPNINTLNVTENIERNLRSVAKSLPPDVTLDTEIFRQADYIQSSVNNVGRALVEGAVCVILVLFLFLTSFRTTVISIVAIPLSLLGTMIVLYLLDMDINTMTLGGMCIAIGSLVDDAIIDVENVYKRLRQNHELPPAERRSTYRVVFEASSEIRASIIHATLIIMVTFMPLFFLSGLEGRMLKPLGVAYLIALVMSLIVAMTVTPLMCSMMLSGDKYLTRNERKNWVDRKLLTLYARSLDGAMRYSQYILGAVVLLLAVSLVLFVNMGRSFLPEFNEKALTIAAVSRPGVSLEESHRIGLAIEKELLEIPEVTSTARRTGRGELDEHSQTANGAEIDVNFVLGERSKEDFLKEVRSRLAAIPGVVTSVGQPLEHRIDHMVSGTQADLAIKVFGPDLNRLFTTGNLIKALLGEFSNVVDVNVEQQVETPQLQIRADREKLALHGITMEQFNAFVAAAFPGKKLGEVYEQERSFDLILRLDTAYTESIDGVRRALIDTELGKVPLEEVASIVSAGGPGSISRENVQRKVVVSANITGGDVAGTVERIAEYLDKELKLDEGYRLEYGGQFESAASASRTLWLTSLVAIGVVFVLLYGEFKSSLLSLVVLLNLPLALIGGVIATYISSGVVSIPAIIGLITLFGIATRNGILLVSRYRHLRAEGVSLDDAVRAGSCDRLTPILMTAFTSALALVPMIIGGGESGNEIQSPMAVVVLGGLLTSTLLNVYVIPIVYRRLQMSRFGDRDNK
ncbi:MAG: efflux RND transporter permease subunit [Bacteroidaceae bacterium]|nr:efflux RND transporter permease subunit [Bacteroidaceae bacterium]